jgi:hypothetical protein
MAVSLVGSTAEKGGWRLTVLPEVDVRARKVTQEGSAFLEKGQGGKWKIFSHARD